MSDLRARLLEACRLQTLQKTGVTGVTHVTEPATRAREPGCYARYACYASDAGHQNSDERQHNTPSGSNIQDWDAADWHAYFQERAAIREYDGGLSRIEAERLAFEDIVIKLHSVEQQQRSGHM
jgi:hypothetical protein